MGWIGRVLLGLAMVALAVPARAAWSPFAGMGSTVLAGNPSCALASPPSNNLPTDTAICAGVGSNGKLLFNVLTFSHGTGGITRATWSGWTAPAAASVLASDPSCAGPNVYDAVNTFAVCGARTGGGQLAVYLRDRGGFEGELLLPLTIASAPSCMTDLQTAQGAEAGLASTGWIVVCAARTPNGQMALAQFNYGYVNAAGVSIRQSAWKEGSWTTSVNALAITPAYSAPSCTAFNNNGGWCAWLVAGNAVAGAFLVARNASNFADPQFQWGTTAAIGGILTRPPSCMFDGNQGFTGMVCFSTGETNSLYGNTYYLSNVTGIYQWSGWESVPGQVNGFSCIDDAFSEEGGGGPNGIVCGMTSLGNGGFWTSVLDDASEWGGWTQQGTGLYVGTPSCVALAGWTSPTMCVVHRADGTAASFVGP